MISAIAARRAIQVSEPDQPTFVPPDDGCNTFSTPTDRPTKRKASHTAGKRVKKARKAKPFESSNGWNGIVTQNAMAAGHDLLKEQHDVIDSDIQMSMSQDGNEAIWTESARPPSARPPSNAVTDESSEDDDNGMQGEGIQLATLLPQFSTSARSDDAMTILSTFKPAFGQNIFIVSEDECSSLGVSGSGTLVCLTVEDSLCLLGSCKLTVLLGSLELCGALLAASKTTHMVYAPRCSPLPIIKSGRDQNSTSVLDDQTIPHRLRGIFEFKTVVIFQSLETGVESLGRICRPFDGMFEPSRWQRISTSSDLKIPGLYMVTNSAKDLHHFSLPSTWSSALDDIMIVERAKFSNPDLPGVFIVKGPKNSGKSTFARTLVNRLLDLYSRVAFLECDIGQSEFTPAGMVSLNVISQPIFGPPFTHPTLPNYAHFIGSSTPRSSPSYYIEAISALIETYRREIQNPDSHLICPGSAAKIADSIPLVVNTMGWTKGFGAEMNRKIESTLQPTDIFELRGSSYETRPDPGVPAATPWVHEPSSFNAYGQSKSFNDYTAKIHILDTVSPGLTTSGTTAADHRNITILSYFHALFPRDVVPGPLEQITAHHWDVSRPLCAMPPFEVDCSAAFDKIILTGAGSEDIMDEEVSRVLNGALVGLVVCDQGAIDQKTHSGPLGLSYTRGCVPPSPLSSKCVGVAAVRGVSSLNCATASSSSSTPTYLHLLTPVPYPLLSQSRVLAKGELELPIWAMLDFRSFFKNGQEVGDIVGVEPENVPYLQWGKAPDGVLGAERRKIRRNLMRRGQL